MGKKKEIPNGTFKRVRGEIFYVGPYVSVQEFESFAKQHGRKAALTDPDNEIKTMLAAAHTNDAETVEKPKSALARMRDHARPFVVSRSGKFRFSTGYEVRVFDEETGEVTRGNLTGETPHQQDGYLRQLFSHATLEG